MRLAALLVCVSLPAAAGQQRVAVLEFDASKAGQDIDRTYFSDLVRGAVHKSAPQLFVMTRESTIELLKASGKKLEDCTGECEVETGKLLGADYVVSGRITKVGTRFSLTLRLHATATGELVETAEARGKSLDALVDATEAAGQDLMRRLVYVPPPQPAPSIAKEPPRPAPEKPAERAAEKPVAVPAPPPSGEDDARLRKIASLPLPKPAPLPTHDDERRARQESEAPARAARRIQDVIRLLAGAPSEKAIAEHAAAYGDWAAEALLREARPVAVRLRLAKALCTSSQSAGCAIEAERMADAGDPAQGLALLRKHCDRGSPVSCGRLASWASSRFTGERRRPDGLFERACDLGEPAACLTLGYRATYGPLKDDAVSKRLFEHACLLELGVACADSAAPMEALCNAGSVESCASLASLYQYGEPRRGIAKDEKVTVAHWAKAQPAFSRDCEEGWSNACMRSWSQLSYGVAGVQSDDPGKYKALLADAFALRCERGFLGFCSSATLNLDPARTEAQVKRIAPIVERACAGGDKDSCADAARAFLTVKDGPKERSFREKACAAGDGLSCSFLSRETGDSYTKAALEQRACRLDASFCQH